MWPKAAEATSGMAWTRSVPTSSRDVSIGYSIIRQTMMSDPDPTEVIPTISPPTMPMRRVGVVCKRNPSPSAPPWDVAARFRNLRDLRPWR